MFTDRRLRMTFTIRTCWLSGYEKNCIFLYLYCICISQDRLVLLLYKQSQNLRDFIKHRLFLAHSTYPWVDLECCSESCFSLTEKQFEHFQSPWQREKAIAICTHFYSTSIDQVVTWSCLISKRKRKYNPIVCTRRIFSQQHVCYNICTNKYQTFLRWMHYNKPALM